MAKNTDFRKELLAELNKLTIEQNKQTTQSNFCPRYDESYYNKIIWDSINYDDIEKIQLKLVAVENETQRDIFDYIRHRVSSMPQCERPGRTLSVLVYDQNSEKFLGIVQLTTDLLKSEFKDRFMGLDEKRGGQLRHHIRDHSTNLSICVPVQPFGFNFCGGKLLAMLAFSTELQEIYTERYAKRIALITTTSIHGKSIQYDRLKQLKFVGYTKGFGISHIPKPFIDKIRDYLKVNHPQYPIERQSNWQLLKVVCQKLNIDSQLIFFHGQQRGIYCGWTGARAHDFMLKKHGIFEQDALQNIDDIYQFWKNRWAKQRYIHLNNEKRLISSDQKDIHEE